MNMCHSSERARRHFFFHHGHCGRGDWSEGFAYGRGEGGSYEGGWGVRRPLRFLVHKLDLDEKQVAELARILDELKIERAQAEVDDRRARAEFADAIAGEAFAADKAGAAGERRVQSAAKVRDALIRALQSIHAVLRPDQRQRLAYLVRTGVLAF
jgi:Spy/CpxP family protein refolding chaperone